MNEETKQYTAFAGSERIAFGALPEVVSKCKRRLDKGEERRIAVYDDAGGEVIDIDYRGDEADVLERLARHPMLTEQEKRQLSTGKPRGRGRPKLGVLSREISLLPKHWEWLAEQPGGASPTLRKLVHAAMLAAGGEQSVKKSLDALHKFMWDMAGNLGEEMKDFEEATRAFYAKDWDEFTQYADSWPKDIRAYVLERVEKVKEQEMPA